MPAYIFAQIDVTNAEGYTEYTKRVGDVIQQFGGKVLARSTTAAVLEGKPRTGRVVVLQFPSVDQAKTFWNSPEYQSVKKFSDGNAHRDITLVEGT
jgi:uncharacterized protein (DUF1330 family)